MEGEASGYPTKAFSAICGEGVKLRENVAEASKKLSLHFGNMLCVDGPILALEGLCL